VLSAAVLVDLPLTEDRSPGYKSPRPSFPADRSPRPDVRLNNAAVVSGPTEKSTFDVVFVCTANRARSALSEAFYRRYTFDFDTRARSFGTLDQEGAPALEHAVDAGRRLGVDLAAHTAAALSNGVLAEADLVLGFEPHHVAAAVIDGDAVSGRRSSCESSSSCSSPAPKPTGLLSTRVP
jgi:hypothetical protein